MTIYNVHKTRLDQPVINIEEQEIDQSTDITLFGRKKLKYGTQLNENLLHLLEHFSCPEDSLVPNTPDLAIAATDQISGITFLTNPIMGQLWYNSTQEHLFFYNSDETRWEPLGLQDDIASNWGIIYNGEHIPKPVSASSGYVFEYSECSWIVSPYQFPGVIDYLLCNSNDAGLVTSIYSVDGDATIYEGFATYLIVGIKNNINLGSVVPAPTPTPTPSITPSTPLLSAYATPTPTITQTPTPTPTPAYIGPLSAIAYNASTYNDSFNGAVEGWWPNDHKDIRYPAISSNRYPLFITPTAPHNPWVPDGGNYYLYVSYAREGGGLNFPYETSTENKYIFVSNDGINGLFYKVIGMTLLGGTILKIQLDVSEDLFTSYYNRIPRQTSLVPTLQFSNYQYIYQVSASSGIDIIDQAPFLFVCPTPYQQNFTLAITGGAPPYTISNVTYSDGKIPISATTSGMTQEIFTGTPVSFSDIGTIDSKYIGVVAVGANPNIALIPNGYVINNFLTADIFYPANYDSLYGISTACRPETFWNYDSTSPCEDYSGYGTNTHSASILIEITDNAGSSVTVPLTSQWTTQTIDVKPSNFEIGLSASITGWDEDSLASASNSYGVPAGEISPVAGTYSYDVYLSLINDVSAVYPTIDLTNLKYLFSILRAPNAIDRGNWVHNEIGAGANLSTFDSGLCYFDNEGLTHVFDDTVFVGYSPLTPYDGVTGDVQYIEIIQYVDVFGVQRFISGNPIIVKLYPKSTAIISRWRALKDDGTNNDVAHYSPDIPYSMQLDIVIPPGLPAAGSLNIPIVVSCTQHTDDTGCDDGAGVDTNVYNVIINFTNA